MKLSVKTSRSTIYALSSGRPPAAIAVVRISGPEAGSTLELLSGARPEPRRATLREIRDPADGDLLDRALVLWMPGPDSVTGEDIAEMHLHGARAVVEGVTTVLARQPRLRMAEPGEFTRRAFENDRIDINEAEGLADLLVAETQGQRRAALLAAGGGVSLKFAEWESELLGITAAIEAAIDYSDEDGVGDSDFHRAIVDAEGLCARIGEMLARPRAERLKDGIRVVFAGPPNCGKSSLVNALAGRDAAIESPIAGTTRDTIEVPISIEGTPFLLIDTAGLRDAQDEIELAGIVKARRAAASADIIIWLGDDDAPLGNDTISLHARADIRPSESPRLPVSARTGQNLNRLADAMLVRAKALLPAEGEAVLNARQFAAASELRDSIEIMTRASDPLIAAFEARAACRLCDSLTGKAGFDQMLDALFSRFCVGK